MRRMKSELVHLVVPDRQRRFVKKPRREPPKNCRAPDERPKLNGIRMQHRRSVVDVLEIDDCRRQGRVGVGEHSSLMKRPVKPTNERRLTSSTSSDDEAGAALSDDLAQLDL